MLPQHDNLGPGYYPTKSSFTQPSRNHNRGPKFQTTESAQKKLRLTKNGKMRTERRNTGLGRGPGYYETTQAFELTKPKTPSVKIIRGLE